MHALLLYHMLCSKLQQPARDDTILRFQFQSYYVNFGPADFATMCSLMFGRSSRLPTRSNFHRIIFNDKRDVIFEDIKKAFVRECKASAGESERCLKLTLLYIVYGMLILEDPSKSIDPGYFHLIDDLDRFNSFPWGSVAYDFLVKHTTNSKKKK